MGVISPHSLFTYACDDCERPPISSNGVTPQHSICHCNLWGDLQTSSPSKSQMSCLQLITGGLQASVEEEVGISGVADAVLVAHSSLAVVRGRKYVVTAIAAGERFPEGALEGAVMHWGCSGSRGGSWLPPPAGWHTLPPISRPAGAALCILHFRQQKYQ